MASFVLSFFPLDVLDGIWDLIESVSEGFLTYSYNYPEQVKGLFNRRTRDSQQIYKVLLRTTQSRQL